MSFDIKAYRKLKRERKYKFLAQERLTTKNTFGIKDLTPYNAVNRILTHINGQSDMLIKYR